MEKRVDRTRMVYKGTNETYYFRNFKTIRALVMKLEIMLLV